MNSRKHTRPHGANPTEGSSTGDEPGPRDIVGDIAAVAHLPVALGREWVGGRVAAPFEVEEPEPHAPDLVLWVELPDGLIVGANVVAPGDPDGQLDRSLLATMHKPAVGGPRRPQRVRVANANQARELAALGAHITVSTAPTPELDEVLATMADDLGSPSYLAYGAVSSPAVEDLFSAAQMLATAAPWRLTGDDLPIRVDIPQLGVREACLIILGAAGQSFGLILFPSLAGYVALAEAVDRGQPDDMGTSFYSLDLDRFEDLPPRMQGEIKLYGWEGSDAGYPMVRHVARDATLVPLDDCDMRLMTTLGLAVSSLAIRYPETFGPDGQPSCISIRDNDDVEVRFTLPYEAGAGFAANDAGAAPSQPKVGRNDLCPCGSGKKYKKCHG